MYHNPVAGDIGEEEKKRYVEIPDEVPATAPQTVPSEPEKVPA